MRRTRLIGAQAELWPDWRHFPFITNRTDPLEVVEAEHRQHAVVELTIRDLKDQALAHFPSGKFNANSAWTVIACLAHNLQRWTSLIGLEGQTVRTARTLRRRLLQIPGRRLGVEHLLGVVVVDQGRCERQPTASLVLGAICERPLRFAPDAWLGRKAEARRRSAARRD